MVNNKSGQRRVLLSIILVMILMMSSLLHSPIATGVGSDDEPPIAKNLPIEDHPAIDVTAEIENILNNVTEDLVQDYIQELQDFGTRYSYAVEKNYQAGDYIFDIYEMNGLNPYFDYFIRSGAKMRNVVAELPGKTASDGIIIICGHYDSISNLPYKSAPGADDNGSGTAAVLAAAELLSDYEFNHTIRFISFSGEEQGLWGSAHYASNSKFLGENITAVINLDMFGYNPDPGSTTIWAKLNGNAHSEDLANYTNSIAQNYTSLDVTVGGTSSNSDHHFFGPEYPAIHIFEDQFSPYYHKTTDTIDKVNLTYIANGTQIAIATIAELAGLNSTDIAPPTPHDMFPAPGIYARENTTISVILKDPSGIDLANLKMLINGSEISPSISSSPLGFNFSYTTPIDFTDGDIITLRIIANDTVGNMLDHNWTFTVDGVHPLLPSDFSINLARVEAVKQGMVLDKSASGYDDAHVIAPSVIFHDNEYKMWYAGNDGSRYRVLYANSSDGMNWNKQGLVIPLGSSGEADDYHASYPSVLFEDEEYKMWYSGYDGVQWRIMYANSTDGMNWIKHGIVIDVGSSGDADEVDAFGCSVLFEDGEYRMWYTAKGGIITFMYANSTDGLVWNKLATPVFFHSLEGEYDSFVIINPSVIKLPDGYGMWYSACTVDVVYRVMYANSTDGINWERQGLAVDVGTGSDIDRVHVRQTAVLLKDGELKIWNSGYDGIWRIFYANLIGFEEKTDLSITWTRSLSTDIEYYDLIRASTPAGLSGAPRYQRMNGTTLVENQLGDGNSSNYYYTLRVIDRVGHVSQHTVIVGKMGVEIIADWNLLAMPFLEGEQPLDQVLDDIPWFLILAYDPWNIQAHWTSNYIFRPSIFNGLTHLNNSIGFWALTTADVLVSTGQVSDTSIRLRSGWNLVAYPYHEPLEVQEALSGVPYDMVEGFDPGFQYSFKPLSDTDMMEPGLGFWVHCTSDHLWLVDNP